MGLSSKDKHAVLVVTHLASAMHMGLQQLKGGLLL